LTRVYGLGYYVFGGLYVQAFYPLHTVIQEYPWGSTEYIPQLLGEPNPDRTPQAELWMGTHPRGPSCVQADGSVRKLSELISEDPEGTLGARVVDRFGPDLPFLLKLLAAAEPLSIQAHPNREQARVGFQRENDAGIPLDAPNRSYKDPNHKPEIICALTPFWGMRGFRPVADIVTELEVLDAPALREPVQRLAVLQDSAALRDLYRRLMTLERNTAAEVVASAAERYAHSDVPHHWWLRRLVRTHPGDIGALSPLLLNVVRLEAGEALFLPAGQLHAYLEGFGVELMANSDNVLRGGLTSKHVDLEELISTLSFAPSPVDPMEPVGGPFGDALYPGSTEEFRLARMRVGHGGPLRVSTVSCQICVCVEGEIRLEHPDSGESRTVAPGRSVFVPARVPGYQVSGNGILYRAEVPEA
jgi:mannose-6-phosphate isomerase